MFLRMPDRFRRVRDPNGTIWTTFGPPAGPARPARAGPKIFFGRGSRGSRKTFLPQRFFLFKNDIHWVLSGFRAQKNSFWAPLDPPKAILAPFTHKMAKMGFKNGQKTHYFEKIFFAPNHFISVPRWSGTLKNPKLAS